ncbi:DUF2164 domain-containing protein [Chengkuizengella axinellae]|uniref:DUF2164 domain-containing protein n=1 Tax=Chengkuizengella axinellae TaxID=3064388 RepID=A0ABT9J2E0_9BACL|nr:DUF2164 domain-containing protein [Chengkuizengella sp. 2205SS18-9]MDP5275779.1 DUF2164 domain-containing protein [Chengkuizengella sp. 2205SS18-9]
MKPTKLPREQKDQMISMIQHYFEIERSEEIGNLAAENFLDFILKEIGPYLYNQGISDARTLINEKMIHIEDDLYALEKQLK